MVGEDLLTGDCCPAVNVSFVDVSSLLVTIALESNLASQVRLVTVA